MNNYEGINMDDSVFIKMLEYGELCGIKGTKWDELLIWLKDQKVIVNIDANDTNRLHALYRECFDDSGKSENYNNRLLKTEYYFRLVEFRELQEARTASKTANKNSLIALTISVIAILVSVCTTTIQLNTSTKINEEQIKEIVEAAKSPDMQNVTIKKEQIIEIVEASRSPDIQNVAIKTEQMKELVSKLETGHDIKIHINYDDLIKVIRESKEKTTNKNIP